MGLLKRATKTFEDIERKMRERVRTFLKKQFVGDEEEDEEYYEEEP